MSTRHLLSGLYAAALMLSGFGSFSAYSQVANAPLRADANDPSQILSDAKDLPVGVKGKVRCLNGKLDGKEKACFKLTGVKPNEIVQIAVYSNNSPVSVAAGTVVDATKELKDLSLTEEVMQASVGFATVYNIGFIDGCVDRYVTLSGSENEFLIITGIVDSSQVSLPPAGNDVAEHQPVIADHAPQGDKPQGDKPQGDKPQGDKPQGDKPQGDKPQGEQAAPVPTPPAEQSEPTAPVPTPPAEQSEPTAPVTGTVPPMLVPQEDKSFFSPLELGVLIGLGVIIVIVACVLLLNRKVERPTARPVKEKGKTSHVPHGKGSYMVRFQCENGPRLKTLLTPEKLIHKPVTFGRSRSNKIVLDDPKLSSHHGCFVYHEGRIAIIDTNSKNGIYVNGERIRSNVPVRLSSRSTIVAGHVRITLSHQ